MARGGRWQLGPFRRKSEVVQDTLPAGTSCLQARRGLAAGTATEADLYDGSPPTPSRFVGTFPTPALKLSASRMYFFCFGVAV